MCSWPPIIDRHMKRTILLALMFILVYLPAEAQCSMCRAVLQSEESQTAAEGINEGIMYLMAFPYLLMAGLAYFIWRSRKSKSSD